MLTSQCGLNVFWPMKMDSWIRSQRSWNELTMSLLWFVIPMGDVWDIREIVYLSTHFNLASMADFLGRTEPNLCSWVSSAFCNFCMSSTYLPLVFICMQSKVEASKSGMATLLSLIFFPLLKGMPCIFFFFRGVLVSEAELTVQEIMSS